MLENLFASIKFLDVFGTSAYFRINRKERFQTTLGGFLGILVVFLFYFHFVINYIKMLDKSDPNIYSIEKFNNNSTISSSSKDLLFFLQFKKESLKYLNMYGILSKDEYFNFKPCNFSEYSDTGLLEELKNECQIDSDYCSYCPDFSSKKEFKYDPQNSLISITLKKNVTNPNEVLNNLPISIKTRKNLFTPEDYNNPIKNYFETKTFLFNGDKSTYINYYVTKSIVESKTISLLNYGFTSEDYGLTRPEIHEVKISEKSKWGLHIFFQNDKLSKYYNRKYDWIDDVLGNAYVFASVVSWIIGLLYCSYNEFKFKEYIFRALVSYDHFNENDKKI